MTDLTERGAAEKWNCSLFYFTLSTSSLLFFPPSPVLSISIPQVELQFLSHISVGGNAVGIDRRELLGSSQCLREGVVMADLVAEVLSLSKIQAQRNFC